MSVAGQYLSRMLERVWFARESRIYDVRRKAAGMIINVWMDLKRNSGIPTGNSCSRGPQG